MAVEGQLGTFSTSLREDTSQRETLLARGGGPEFYDMSNALWVVAGAKRALMNALSEVQGMLDAGPGGGKGKDRAERRAGKPKRDMGEL
mmetsp:Transcript_57846/g.183442  ORF Transcript_57846/g.183442 Transcript_57846/m.183442 type:complete len:89 (-) Transcript_57846:576-842(-)